MQAEGMGVLGRCRSAPSPRHRRERDNRGLADDRAGARPDKALVLPQIVAEKSDGAAGVTCGGMTHSARTAGSRT